MYENSTITLIKITYSTLMKDNTNMSCSTVLIVLQQGEDILIWCTTLTYRDHIHDVFDVGLGAESLLEEAGDVLHLLGGLGHVLGVPDQALQNLLLQR
jgi:hypothetical protein